MFIKQISYLIIDNYPDNSNVLGQADSSNDKELHAPGKPQENISTQGASINSISKTAR